jgi:hypothetical protein
VTNLATFFTETATELVAGQHDLVHRMIVAPDEKTRATLVQSPMRTSRRCFGPHPDLRRPSRVLAIMHNAVYILGVSGSEV